MKRINILFFLLIASFAVQAQSWELNRIKSLIEAGKYLEAAQQLRPLADNGNAEAQYIAAGLFAEGKGVKKNLQQAEKYYQMSARQMYEPAICSIAEFYFNQEQYTKAFNALQGAIDKDENLKNGCVGFRLAYLHFYGKTPNCDPEKGWTLLYDLSEIESKSRNDYIDALRAVHKEFYEGLIDKGFSNETPESLVKKLAVDYGRERGYWKFSDYAIEYYIEKLRTMDADVQAEHFKCWSNPEYKGFVSGFALNLLLFEGLGTEKDIKTSKLYAKGWDKKYLEEMSYIHSRQQEILNEFYVNEEIPYLGKVKSVSENGDIKVSKGKRAKVFTKQELHSEIARINDILKERQEKIDNITVTNSCRPINARFKGASWFKGNLHVTFAIELKSHPKRTVTVESPFAFSDNGKRYNASYDIGGSGLDGNLLKPNSEAYITIIVKNAPEEGEFKYVKAKVTLSVSNVGELKASNVVWFKDIDVTAEWPLDTE